MVILEYRGCCFIKYYNMALIVIEKRDDKINCNTKLLL